MLKKVNGNVYLKKLVSDDDSTMRSLLQHKTVHDKDQLQEDIPQPIFLCDPSHIIKIMAKPIFKMVSKTKDPAKMQNH